MTQHHVSLSPSHLIRGKVEALPLVVCYNGVRPPTSSPSCPLCKHYDVGCFFPAKPLLLTQCPTVLLRLQLRPQLTLQSRFHHFHRQSSLQIRKTTRCCMQSFPTPYAPFLWSSLVEPRPPTDTMSPIWNLTPRRKSSAVAVGGCCARITTQMLQRLSVSPTR